jgi:RES domain-containing protein
LTRVYRVLRKAYARSPFDGQGAYLYGGRWSSPGTRLAYTSEHQSLAMLEYFVHLDVADAAGDLVLVMAEIPDDLPQERVAAARLPSTWRDFPAPPELAQIGDDFVRRGENCVLIVPSALAPYDHNWLLNPQHEVFRKVVISEPEPVIYDSRMFAPRRGRRTRGERLNRKG